LTQQREALPIHLREWILHRCHHAADPGVDDPAGTWAGSTRMRARLQRAVQSRTVSGVTGFVQRVDFRVWLSRTLVRALPDQHALTGDNAGAHQRVGRCAS
jgi:hypothetical protein